jgi:hypothetical protein
MVSTLLFYQLLLVALVLICLLMYVAWPDDPPRAPIPPPQPHQRRRRRVEEPKPFPGHKPLCAACEQAADAQPKAPGLPPPIIRCTRGRRRTVDTHAHFCPEPACSYHGWLGRGNIRSNGHPGGQPWRQLQCVSCQGYFSETHGTIFQGKRSSVALIVRVIACLAEGLGIRGHGAGVRDRSQYGPSVVGGGRRATQSFFHLLSARVAHQSDATRRTLRCPQCRQRR